MSVLSVLINFYGDKKFHLSGDDYAGLEWLDDSEKPTEAEIKALEAKSDAMDAAKPEIAELKAKLAATDYVALADYDKSKPEVIAQRQQWRDRIRELES
jgi:hypothetical protein